MVAAIRLAILVFTLLGNWLNDQKVRGKMRLEDEKRLEVASRKWADADPDSVRPDDPELFSE